MYIYEKFRNIHIRINDLWSSDVCTFLLAFRDIGMLAMFPMWYMYVTSTWSAALAYQLEHGCARSWRWESDGNGGRMMLVLKTDGDGGWCSMQRQWRRRRLHTCLTLPIGPADEWSPEAHPSPFRSDPNPIRNRFGFLFGACCRCRCCCCSWHFDLMQFVQCVQVGVRFLLPSPAPPLKITIRRQRIPANYVATFAFIFSALLKINRGQLVRSQKIKTFTCDSRWQIQTV